MTAEVAGSPRPAPQPTPHAPAPVPGRSAWRLSWPGIRTVAVLELRQRVRSTRWVIVLVLWTALLGALTTLVWFAVHRTLDAPPLGAPPPDSSGVAVYSPDIAQQAAQSAGATMFGIIAFLVLGLAGLVAPALTATSVNGDRSAGVLATLQTTLLSPAEIVVGKLLAAWATALALLVCAAPFIGWAYVEGGTPAGRLAVTVGLVAVTLLVVCAIALGWSAITARTSTSAVLTYLSVAFLGLGLPLLFAVSLPLVQQTDTVTVTVTVATDGGDGTGANGAFTCQTSQQRELRPHTERVWWLLAPNPFVIVADAAPHPARSRADGTGGTVDPLSVIRVGVREARLGPPLVQNWGCPVTVVGDGAGASFSDTDRARTAQRDAVGSVWPYGLAADLATGAAFLVVAVRRLRAPTRALPRGTRVA